MADIVTLAEKALVARQKLPLAFGYDALRPSYDGLGLGNIASVVMELLHPESLSLKQQTILPPFNPEILGVSEITETWKSWLHQAPIHHVVMLLVDALGYDQLRTVMQSGDAPGLAEACVQTNNFFIPATSVFPTMTVTALSSAATAHAPAQHGIVCTHLYLQELGSLVNLIGLRPSIAPTPTPYSENQLNPKTLLPVPNIYQLLEQAGICVEIINFHQYKDSGISRFTTAGSRAGSGHYISYLTPTDGFAQLRERLQTKSNQSKSFTYMYLPNIDNAGHVFGPLSSCYRAEVAALDFSLKRELFEPLAGRDDVVLLLVADHGQRCFDPGKILWLNKHPGITQHLFVPAISESRACFFYTKPGREVAVIDYVQRYLSDNFLVVTKAVAVELGLFGLPGCPLGTESSDRIGELILISPNGWVCLDDDSKLHYKGIHGGLSREEMLIPFLAYRF
ncbi:MAG: alkaline phosphatase family protein [Scytonema sp. PMC 1069.18]|nr:alkaline phosphatase family protein [Scytonema sp. PMC 1069.18]MEC4881423.1 alkaline phosphatase family protein [Scytonema sp. PMC 1070.18]